MLNIVVPINDNFDKYRKMFDFLQDKYDVNVFLGATSKYYGAAAGEFEDVDSFRVFEFDDGTDKEEMIDAMQDYLEPGEILVLRKPINSKEFDKIVNAKFDIVVNKTPRTKFRTLMFNLWQKITKFFLGVRTYPGEPSVVFFNTDIANVVASSASLSYSSRVNRWKGVKQMVLTIEGENDKKKIDKAMNIRNILIASLLIAIGAVVTTVVALFVKMTIIIALLLVCLDGICLAVATILTIMMIFSNMTGPKKTRKAIILQRNFKLEGE